MAKTKEAAIVEVPSSKEIAVMQRKVSPMVEKAKTLEINDAKTMTVASDMRVALKKVEKELTADKDNLTKPLKQVVKDINAKYEPFETQLDEALELVTGKMGAYQTAEKKRADEEAARIAARVGEGKGHLKVETAVAKIDEIERPKEAIKTEVGGTSFRTDVKVTITPIADMPEEQLLSLQNQLLIFAQEGLLMWNEPAVRALIKEKKSNDLLPGVTFEEVQTPVNSR